MNDVFTKTLSKRVATKESGIYYKEVQQTTIDSKGKSKTKIIDKVFIIRYRDDGKERLVTMGKYSEGIREAYCKAKRNEFLTLAKNGELPPQIEQRKKKPVIALDEIAAQHYEFKSLHNRKNEQSRTLYKNHISPFIGDKSLDEVLTSDLEKIQYAKVKDGKSPKYCNDIINEISVIFNWAVTKGLYIGINPAKAVKRLKVDNKRERFLSIEEVKRLLEEVSDDEQLYLFTLIALNTGVRAGAAMQIQKKDIDLHSSFITLIDEKNQETYKSFLENRKLISLLQKRIMTLNQNDFILDYKTARVTKIDAHVYNRMKPILNRLFNKDIKPTDRKHRAILHTLRHTFASHLAINGTPIFTIQKLMNHKTIEMTMRYAKLAPESGRDAIKGLYAE